MDAFYKNIINERIEQYGISALTDEEAISVLTGISLKDVSENLNKFGLPELIKFIKTMKLTKAQSKKLSLLYHLAKRISVSEFKEKLSLKSSSKAGEYFVKELQFLEIEMFLIAMLDAQNRLIKVQQISIGTIDEAPVYPREIIKHVLNNNASSIIVAHNHPGGSLKASSQDVELTKRLSAALKTINVKLLDHIIVAENSYISLADKGILY